MGARQFSLDIEDEVTVDLFAGGGGVSMAFEMATGKHITVAVNHSDDALSMHRANHPHTEHHVSDIYEVDPREVGAGRPIGYVHASPDCTHHSQASGGQPRDRKIRSLSWALKRWLGQTAPRLATLENVAAILKWGPLVAKRDPATGRVIKLVEQAPTGARGTTHVRRVPVVAAKGERVPLRDQYLVPDPKRVGQTWRRFVRDIEAMGYVVEYKIIDASKHGAGTRRLRLYMIARRDGEPIVWPADTHAPVAKGRIRRESHAADHLDFSLPCHSIFLSKAEGRAVGVKRPLEEASMRRIATGVVDYVIEAKNPYIVPPERIWLGAAAGPAAGRDGAAAFLQQITQRRGARSVARGLPTITGSKGGEQLLVTAFMAQHNTMPRGGIHPGHDLRRGLSSITGTGSQQALVTAHLAHFRRHCDGRAVNDPLMTISAGGEHHALVESSLLSTEALAPPVEEQALRVAAFLMRYHGSGGQWSPCGAPLTTVTTRDRLALVTVTLQGTAYVIVDIGVRMLTPRELYLCQGFPAHYQIDRGHDGRIFSKAKQIRMCGNSVSPPPMAAIIGANYRPPMSLARAA